MYHKGFTAYLKGYSSFEIKCEKGMWNVSPWKLVFRHLSRNYLSYWSHMLDRNPPNYIGVTNGKELGQQLIENPGRMISML